jgi:hypothetical protein
VAELNKELVTFDRAGLMKATDRWKGVVASVKHLGAGFVVLDNVAHLFTGDENVRNHVAAFTGLLNQLAGDINGGVLLLGHPNKAGAEYSGSTGWENQVRARIYLGYFEDEGGNIVDPDARRLTNSKPNYGRRGDAIDFLWHNWAFVLPSDLPPDEMSARADVMQAETEDERFLQCLAKATAEGRATSASKSAQNFAPKVFAAMPTAKGMKAAAFRSALERLLDRGDIRADVEVGQYANRTPRLGIGLAQNPAQNPAQNVCTEAHEGLPAVEAQEPHKGAHAPGGISKDMTGPSSGGVNPSFEDLA